VVLPVPSDPSSLPPRAHVPLIALIAMGVVRLGICVSGVYTAFLFWAIAQERRE
jgi:hypothetical protein